MSQEKLLISLITALEEKELYIVAKVFLKEVDGIENVINCNGPWDSGIDMTTLKLDIQIQATVEQKNFEKKLFSDLAKAKKNVEQYNLPNKIKYFYSYTLSNTSILRFKKQAKDNFNLYLDIIDANRLSEISLEFSEISKLLYDISKLEKFQAESKYFDNVKVKAYYDLMSFGKATDIKYNIIKSFIINYIFNNTATDKDTLLSKTNEHFGSKIEQSYFESVIARLSSEQKIKNNQGEFILLKKERERIDTVLQEFKIEESLLIRDITNALEKYGITNSVDKVIGQLSELYESNYKINLSEFTYKDSNIYDIKTATQKLKSLVQEISENHYPEKEINSLLKLLIQIADSSEILPRIAAGQVYSKVSDPDRLQRYVSQNLDNKTIFLDANVILNLLLVHYESEANYNNYNYKIARQFYKFYKSNNLILKTIKNYSIEIASLFREALYIIPFTRLKDEFSSLGGSSNIFYKFYQQLKDEDLLKEKLFKLLKPV